MRLFLVQLSALARVILITVGLGGRVQASEPNRS